MDKKLLEGIVKGLMPGTNRTCTTHKSSQRIDYLQIGRDSIYVSFDCGCIKEYAPKRNNFYIV